MNKSKYLPSIDSLRAIAVIAVIIYHINVDYLPGGFLGVDLFFVLSGYLISSLIMREYSKTGTIDLKNFYIRRARRLLPAVYFMITVVVIFMTLFNKVLLEKSNLDALFGYLYTSNWWYIFHKLDYFDTFGAQSPFKHLWSLAIEEQFYMFFPLIFLLMAKVKEIKIGARKIAFNFRYVVIFLILLSLFTHIILFDINNISRVYFGTDTRAFSLLVGVLGATIYPMDKLKVKESSRNSTIFSIVSSLTIIILIIVMNTVSEYNTWLYYGGFLLIAILCLIVIISSGKQNTLMSRLLSFKPLVFIGKISYSLYLWHFPVLILTTPVSEIGNPNIFFTILRVVLIFVLAFASYLFIETPIRKQGLIVFVKDIYGKFKLSKKTFRQSILASLGIVVILFVLGMFGKGVPYLSTAFVNSEKVTGENEFVATNTDKKESVNTEQKENQSENKDDANKVYNTMIFIGDSLAVDIGTEAQKKYKGAFIDGKVSRQLSAAIPIASNYSQYNSENTAVVFQLGTNGPFTENQLEDLIAKFDKADIYFVNVKVPRTWESNVNKTLQQAAEKHSNIKIIDWYSLAKDNPQYFAADKVHLERSGITALVELIDKNLKHKVEIK